jgi:hypothetical protein
MPTLHSRWWSLLKMSSNLNYSCVTINDIYSRFFCDIYLSANSYHFYANFVWYTVEPAHVVTSIKQSPVLKCHLFCPVIDNFKSIEPLLRGHLSYKPQQLVNFITLGCESSAPFFVIYKAGRKPKPYWW